MNRSLIWLLLGLALPALACNLNASQPLAQNLTATAALTIPTMQPTATRPATRPAAQPATTMTVTSTLPATLTTTPSPTTTPTPCARRNAWPTVTVAAGDTLFRIAQRVGSTVDELVTANCLADRNRLSVGQTLHVPRLPPTPTTTPSPTPQPQPTVISNWTDPVIIAPDACYTLPFFSSIGIAVGERWRIADALGGVTLHGAAVANQPVAVLAGGTPFTVVAGPTCFTAQLGSSTLAFRRWQVAPLDGRSGGWLDEWDPFTKETLIMPDPQVMSFTAVPASISTGGAVTLSWVVTGAEDVYLFTYHNLLRYGNAMLNDGKALPASGSLTVTPPPMLRRVLYAIGFVPRNEATVTVDIACTEPFFVNTRDTLFACPAGAPDRVPAAYQPFERGFMVWQNGTIWVFASGAASAAFVDGWNGELITFPEEPPAGLWLPARGFGKIWTEVDWVRSALGWALTPEQAYTMTLQQTQTAYATFGYFFDLPDGRLIEAYLYYGTSLDWNVTTRRARE